MKFFRWFTTISMIVSAAISGYRLYKNWQMSREQASLTS